MARRKKKDLPPTQRDPDLSYTLSRVSEVMHERAKALNPLPVEPLRIWAAFFSEDELRAVRTLLRCKHAEGTFSFTKEIRIAFSPRPLALPLISEPFVKTQAHIDMPREIIGPKYGLVSIEHLHDTEMAATLEPWFRQRVEHLAQAHQVYGRVQYLLNHGGTARQVAQVWPELQGFMSQAMRDRIAAAKVKSRLPDVAGLDRFSRAALEPLNYWISEALLLTGDGKRDGVGIH